MSEIYTRTTENMDMETKDSVIFQMQDHLDKLEHDYENLIEQIRLANQQRFGRHTENAIAGQLSFFNEAKANCVEDAAELTRRYFRREKQQKD